MTWLITLNSWCCVPAFLVPLKADFLPRDSPLLLHQCNPTNTQAERSAWWDGMLHEGVDICNLFLYVSVVFVCVCVHVLMWEAPVLGANLMFTSLVMKLEPCGAHTTGLHWSSNSITPLINAQMLLADPGPHTAFATQHSLSGSSCFFTGLVISHCLTDAQGSHRFLHIPMCLFMRVVAAPKEYMPYIVCKSLQEHYAFFPHFAMFLLHPFLPNLQWLFLCSIFRHSAKCILNNYQLPALVVPILP